MSNAERVQNLLTGAGELPPGQRGAYLEAACGGDANLRAEVESLLHSLGDAGRFLSNPTGDVGHGPPTLSGPTTAATPSEREGQTIGRYKLLQPIGEGGFGSVWMAEQREPVKRRVALKIIKLGMDTRQVIARFEAERQALALMDHPNIAKVLDAGSTETGRPYFVMEYIKGVPILEYCDTEKLDTKARLDLFTRVCHAIQHAHQKGIIHRDIKPSNVLITMHDGVPVPKVIDFGIAKATSSELTDKTLFTEHRQMIGTPAYMSPEQAEMSGLDIDTRSDIYSLGVLLYELLTGTTPFSSEELRSAGHAEMMRIIREVEPHKPSTRLSTLGNTATRTAHQRHEADPKRLGLILRGDLDWIVMKCLEKDRTRRYETASGLAADIKRHLSDEPVTARAPTGGYRLRKFVKRNRGQVIAGAVVAGALVLGVIGTSAGLVNALAERSRANAEAARAVLSAESEGAARKRAETIAEFMSEALLGAGPSVARGRDITMLKEIMDSAAVRIEKGELKAVPEAEIRLRISIGNTYRELAQYDAAQRLVGPAVAMARSAHAGDHLVTADSLVTLAMLHHARGDLAGAEPLLRESLEMYRRLFPGGSRDMAACLNALGNLLRDRGDLAGSESMLREAVDIMGRVYPGGHRDLASCIGNLANLLRARGDLAGVEPLYREAMEMHRRGAPGDSPEVATGLNNLGSLLQEQGDLAGAEPLMRDSLAMTRRLFPGDHPETTAVLVNMAGLLRDRGELEESERLCREALDMSLRLFPGDHPNVAFGLTHLARTQQLMGKNAEARRGYDQAIAIFRRSNPDGSPMLARVLWRSGGARLDEKGAAAALPEFDEAMAMAERFLPPAHPTLKEYRQTLAACKEAIEGARKKAKD